MSSLSQDSVNNDFYQLFEPSDDQYALQFLGTIVSEIKVERFQSTKIKFSFLVMQSEHSAMDVFYVSSKPEEEIKFNNLRKVTGSVIYSNNVRRDGDYLEIVYDNELILLIMNPTTIQLNRFLKEILYYYKT